MNQNNMILSGDSKLDEQINNWRQWDGNPQTQNEISKAVENKEWDALKSRLCIRINFGTAGLRAEMRAGFDSMNDLVVVQTAQGLCEYLKNQYPDKSTWSGRGIVIGYDARHNSKRFAELSAAVFLCGKFRVYLFKQFAATPIVPYTIKKLNCLAGVQVTASHNPKQDNGYKVYWSNGAQIISPHDTGIQESILNNLKPMEDYWSVNEQALWSKPLLSNPYDKVVPAYFEALKEEIPSSFIQANDECPLKFAYTPMHGVGYPYVEEAFKQINLKNVCLVPVSEQVEPDPEFPTTPMPNPEEGKQSLDLAIKTATEENCQIILANDPDADRLAVAEISDNNKYKLFSGNELGALLGWWSKQIYNMKEPHGDISNCVMIASTVSSKILKSMAAVEGFIFHETLTGFKWMGNKAIEEELAGKKVLFAFEEAIGFMVSTNVVDKDGVSAAAHVATMARYLRCEKSMTLQDKLRDIYETYGYHTSICSYCICRDQVLIRKIFQRLRTFDNGKENTYPKSILNGEFEIEHVRDLTTGYDSSTADKRATLPVSSSSQMITFTFKNGLVAIVNEFYEPEKNQLQRKSAD
ncbi:GH21282 [Drosophila grimshawi]|uniref:GH21282 n=1 Tax=Drosophila grimshawi TaxID=7222 RepID=B4J7V7_DROGR|nr:GH21282 [Drosophila grimshawi]